MKNCDLKLFHYFDGGTSSCEKCEDLCYDDGIDPKCQENCKDFLFMKHLVKDLEKSLQFDRVDNLVTTVNMMYWMLFAVLGLLLVILFFLCVQCIKCKKNPCNEWSTRSQKGSIPSSPSKSPLDVRVFDGNYENVQSQSQLTELEHTGQAAITKNRPLPSIPSMPLTPRIPSAPRIPSMPRLPSKEMMEVRPSLPSMHDSPGQQHRALKSRISSNAESQCSYGVCINGSENTCSSSSVRVTKPKKKPRTLSGPGSNSNLSGYTSNMSDTSLTIDRIRQAGTGYVNKLADIDQYSSVKHVGSNRMNLLQGSQPSSTKPVLNSSLNSLSPRKSSEQDVLPKFYGLDSTSSLAVSESLSSPNVYEPHSVYEPVTRQSPTYISNRTFEDYDPYSFGLQSDDGSVDAPSPPSRMDIERAYLKLGPEVIRKLKSYDHIEDVAMDEHGRVFLFVPRLQLANIPQDIKFYVRDVLHKDVVIYPITQQSIT